MTTFTVEQIKSINELATSLYKNGKVPNLARGIEQAKEMLIPAGQRMRSARELALEVEKIKKEFRQDSGVGLSGTDLSSMGQMADLVSKGSVLDEDSQSIVSEPSGMISYDTISPASAQVDKIKYEDIDEDETLDNFEDTQDIDEAIAFQQGVFVEVEKEDEEAVKEEEEDDRPEDGKPGDGLVTEEDISSDKLFIPPSLAFEKEEDSTPLDEAIKMDIDSAIDLEQSKDDTAMIQPINPILDPDEMKECDIQQAPISLPGLLDVPSGTAMNETKIQDKGTLPMKGDGPDDFPPDPDEVPVPDVFNQDIPIFSEERNENEEEVASDQNLPIFAEANNGDEEKGPSDQIPLNIAESKHGNDVEAPGGLSISDGRGQTTAAEKSTNVSAPKENNLAGGQYDDPSFDISKELRNVEDLFSEEEKKEHIQEKKERFIRDDAED